MTARKAAVTSPPKSMPPLEIGWAADGQTGWGLLASHLALSLSRRGVDVVLSAGIADATGLPDTLFPTLASLCRPVDVAERRIRIDAYGNHWPAFQEIPNRTRVLLAVFEDSAIPDSALEHLKRYDLILAPSTWCQSQLAQRGIPSTVWHQGYDDSLFRSGPRRRPRDRLYVFSGGKLEFRKGQDIVVEAFKRFRATPEGQDAILVTAWQNRWPQTMAGIYESGYVRGVPTMRNGRLDITAWLVANGLPEDAVIDLGMLAQAELANAIRECDVGLFPNRGEGATNMVLAETLGLGLPCIVSANTGHLDVTLPGVVSLHRQSPVTRACSLFRGMDGWGESDPDEIVDVLRLPVMRAMGVPSVSEAARDGFGWSTRTDAFLAALEGVFAHA